ncbi:MAG: rRNA pseudouridine synthase [Firmicutes bacterium]|nr:rRNA pseudouridine synthase [Bacillota bacterium]
MRLNKYIAQAGIASRRKADELIACGNVKINGEVVRELGTDVKEGDAVEVNGRRIAVSEKKVYILLNKPVGYVTTSADEKDRATVLDLVADVPERIFPVGRLDYNTSGLLILTNDGDLAYRLTHPKHHIYKTYRVQAAGVLSNERAARLRRGVDIGGFVTSPAKVKVIKQGERSVLAEIQIYEGKNRQVRKMFAAVGNKVTALKRTALGDIRLGRLMEGHYRKLTREEIEYLKSL